jgi:hypothetical protein
LWGNYEAMNVNYCVFIGTKYVFGMSAQNSFTVRNCVFSITPTFTTGIVDFQNTFELVSPTTRELTNPSPACLPQRSLQIPSRSASDSRNASEEFESTQGIDRRLAHDDLLSERQKSRDNG